MAMNITENAHMYV